MSDCPDCLFLEEQPLSQVSGDMSSYSHLKERVMENCMPAQAHLFNKVKAYAWAIL